MLVLAVAKVYAQKVTVSGTIRDKKTGEVLIGATVNFEGGGRPAISSNSYGFYSISAVPGRYTFIFSFTGYQPDTIAVDLRQDILVPVDLAPAGGRLAEVVVSARKRNENVVRPLMGVQ